MYMPDDFDVPQDDLEDLIELEYEAEMEMMRELEQEAAEAAIRSHENDKQKEDRPPTQAVSRATRIEDVQMVS